MDETITSFQQRLNKFVSQYYLNLFIKGLVFFTIGFLVIILFSTGIEYFLWTSNQFRLFLLLASILGIVFIFYYFLLIPILRYFSIFPRITYKHAIAVISEYYPDSKDLLINILEISYLYKSDSSNLLLRASIEQKVKISESFDFTSVANNRNILPLVKYLIGVVVIYLFIFIFNPEIITDSTTRIINYQSYYVKNFGFRVEIDSSDLKVEKGQNRIVNIKLTGDKFPEYINMYVNGQEFLLEKKDFNHFKYEFKNVTKPFLFRIVNSYFVSNDFQISIIDPPTVLSYNITVNYPEYLNLSPTFINDQLSLKVPYGSELIWNFTTTMMDSLLFKEDSVLYAANLIDKKFQRAKKLYGDYKYSIVGINSNLEKFIYSNNVISIIPDLFPSIIINEINDIDNANLFFYKGLISDDYGFNKLEFVYNNGIVDSRIEIPLNKRNNNQEFYFSFDYSLIEDKKVTAFFIVYDNDALNNFKGTKSEVFYHKILDYDELVKNSDNRQLSTEKDLKKTSLLAEELLEVTKEIKKKLLNENLTSFEKSQLLDELLYKQNSLNDLLNSISKNNLNKSDYDKNLTERNKEILEKNEEVQKLLESVLTEELKSLIRELEKLKGEFNQEKFNDIEKQLGRNYEELAKQLDRNLELLKRMDVENKIDELISKLNKLSERQDSLSKELLKEDNFNSTIELKNENQKLAESLFEQYNTIDNKNQELEKPMDIGSFKDDFLDLKEDAKEIISPDNSKERNSGNALKNSKKAKEIANEMTNAMMKDSKEQDGEDSEALRQILENLIYFSFEQERISILYNKTSNFDPQFNDVVFEQSNLKDIYSIIKDSLYAVSKRTPYLGNHISKKAFSIENKLFLINEIENRENASRINLEQRYIIEYSNDLILLLSESLKNLENASGSGSGNTKKKNKPKPGKPSLSEMRTSQEGIKQQLEEMIKQMQEGGSKGGFSNSEDLGKILARQEIFQQMINEISSGSGVGKEYAKELNEISKLIDENKKDIAKRQISTKTVYRQQQIVTRLLEAEKAEQEREVDNIRKSNEAIYFDSSDIKLRFEQSEQIINFDELFNKSSIQLQYFYKNKYQDYINKLNRSPNETGN